jgi:hypothetical protein
MSVNRVKWHADKVERKPLSDLIPYAQNPQQHEPEQVDQIAKWIERVGWTMPVLIDEAGKVIAGHGRILAAEHMGLDSIPCVIASGWTDADKRAYRIFDNAATKKAAWDDELLGLELEGLGDIGFDLELTGLSEGDILGINTAPQSKQDNDGDFIPDKDPNVLVRLSFHPGIWLGKREEIIKITDKMKKTYECEVKIEE